MSTVPTRCGRTVLRRAAAAPATAGFRRSALALAVAFALNAGAHAQSTPAGALSGSATYQRNGDNLLVTTTNGAGHRSVLNWQAFNVPTGSTTWFQQPDAASTSINRVTGGVRSDIFGTLGSNGQLVLVNPSGIAIGAHAMVDTAGFTASTLSLSESDAIAGRLRFQGGASALTVGEGAQILARGGDVVLVGSQVQVERNAVIRADGAAILAAGEKVEITGRGLEGILLEVQAGNEAVNLGTLQGDAVGIFAQTLKHSGIVNAQAVSADGGKVVLQAIGGDALVSGTVTAAAADGQGGAIDVLGQRVGLLAGAALDASGANGGGFIRVGGDYQGSNPDVPNAQRTYVDAQATIRADATLQGDGGRVIVWSDRFTRMDGRISARGGAKAGDGGFAEVSGKQLLAFNGTADLRAPRGSPGTLLLDPEDVAIVHSESTTSVNTFPQSDPEGIDDAVFEPSSTGPVQLSDTQLNNQLALGNVRVQTSSPTSTGTGGDITVDTDAQVSWTSPSRLTLQADKGITVDGTITGANGSLSLQAAGGDVTQGSGSAITVGSLVVKASGSVDLAGSVSGRGGIDITATGGGISFGDLYAQGDGSSAATVDGGNVTLKASGDISGGTIYANGALYYTGNAAPTSGHGGNVNVTSDNGGITLDGITASSGSYDGEYAGVSAGAAGNVTLTTNKGTGVGDISVWSIEASGGDATGAGATPSSGGTVIVNAKNGGVFLGTVEATGGSFMAPGSADGAAGGKVSVTASGNIVVSEIDVSGGSTDTGVGGQGGEIHLNAGGSLVGAGSGECDCYGLSLYARGGSGGTDDGGNGLRGGKGGLVQAFATGDLVVDGGWYVDASGGAGGASETASAGQGGDGGDIQLAATGRVELASPTLLTPGGGNGGLIGTLRVSGTSVDVTSDLDLSSDWINESLVNISGTSSVTGAGMFHNNGQLMLADTANLEPLFGVANAGSLTTSGTNTVDLTLNSSTGTVDVQAASKLTAPGFIANDGTVRVDGILDVGFVTDSVASSGGTVMRNNAGGTLTGNGSIVVSGGQGTIDNFGTIAPGAAGGVGTLTLDAALIMEAASVYAADLQDSANHDSLVVTGAVSSGGSYAVNYLPGAAFAPGDSFRMVQAGSLDASTAPGVDKPELQSQASGNELVLVAAATFPAPPPPPAPAPATPPADQSNAQQQSNNQLATFAELFMQMSDQQQGHAIGKDDIVVTDTACTR